MKKVVIRTYPIQTISILCKRRLIINGSAEKNKVSEVNIRRSRFFTEVLNI